MGKNEREVTEHPAYGTISVSRVHSGRAEPLFGSGITHHNMVRLRITEAKMERNLCRDWILPQKVLVELDMSETQFGHFISSAGIGEGTPCTLRRVMGKSTGDITHEHERMRFAREFGERVQELSQEAESMAKELTTVLNGTGTVTKKERERMKWLVRGLMQSIQNNIPFVMDQFNDALDKNVGEAKGEVEGYILAKAHRFAGTELGRELTMMLPQGENADEAE
jgi:ElaB/YqjD/DUF883 family membrane-anchored ribosome-binding protein